MSEVETKQPDVDAKQVAPANVDQAWDYLASHANNQSIDYVDLAATRRKIDLRIMPFMFCCYFLQFIDKVMYNVSFSVRPEPGFPTKTLSHSMLLSWA